MIGDNDSTLFENLDCRVLYSYVWIDPFKTLIENLDCQVLHIPDFDPFTETILRAAIG